ncbi:MAG: CSLREA domain-containing protein [Anaerolineae bacterium]|nr:CSLREA domain-containing protein [Anaerolineae bacterium]
MDLCKPPFTLTVWKTIVVLAFLAAMGGAIPAHAASITVTTTADELNADGDCSLREAIQAVNTRSPVDACPAGTGNDLIVLPAGTYAITWAGGGEDNNATGDLDVFPAASPGGTVTIQGAGAGATILDGGGLDRVLHLIRDDSRLVMQDVTIRNGRLTDQAGAGVLSWGALELRRVVLEDSAERAPALSAADCASAASRAPAAGFWSRRSFGAMRPIGAAGSSATGRSPSRPPASSATPRGRAGRF